MNRQKLIAIARARWIDAILICIVLFCIVCHFQAPMAPEMLSMGVRHGYRDLNLSYNGRLDVPLYLMVRRDTSSEHELLQTLVDEPDTVQARETLFFVRGYQLGRYWRDVAAVLAIVVGSSFWIFMSRRLRPKHRPVVTDIHLSDGGLRQVDAEPVSRSRSFEITELRR